MEVRPGKIIKKDFLFAGRWRAGSVAVKIINHDKHVGNNFDAMRESVLCSNINHPNVVMTYKVIHSTTWPEIACPFLFLHSPCRTSSQ